MLKVTGISVRKYYNIDRVGRVYCQPPAGIIAAQISESSATLQRLYREQLLPVLCEKFKLPADEVKFSWSKVAGCKCGCSPGFICKSNHLKGVDVTVHYAVE
jgi:hypothetical protein